MPRGQPFPGLVAKYFAGEIPFRYLDRKDREFVREYERDRKRRYRARKERLLKKTASPGGTVSTYHS